MSELVSKDIEKVITTVQKERNDIMLSRDTKDLYETQVKPEEIQKVQCLR